MSALTSQLAWHCPAWLSRGHERQSWWRHHLPQARRQIAAFDKEIIVHLGMAQTGGKPSPSTEIAPLGGGPPRTTMRMKMKPSLFKRGKCPSCVRAGTTRIAEVEDWRYASHVLLGTMSAGFQKFFKRCAEELARAGGPKAKRIEAFGLETASTSWRPCRSVLAGQLVCSAKLSDQIL
jgi:hypothetical protein